MFKVGDKVNVKDRAWSAIVNNTDEDGYASRIRSLGPDQIPWDFRIIGINCAIQIQESYGTANTLIQNDQTGTIWAINNCNLIPISVIEVHFISNGFDITDTMSEQSKRAVLKANNY